MVRKTWLGSYRRAHHTTSICNLWCWYLYFVIFVVVVNVHSVFVSRSFARRSPYVPCIERRSPVAAGFLEFLCFRFAFEFTHSTLNRFGSLVVVKYFCCVLLYHYLPMAGIVVGISAEHQLFAVLLLRKVLRLLSWPPEWTGPAINEPAAHITSFANLARRENNNRRHRNKNRCKSTFQLSLSLSSWYNQLNYTIHESMSTRSLRRANETTMLGRCLHILFARLLFIGTSSFWFLRANCAYFCIDSVLCW